MGAPPVLWHRKANRQQRVPAIFLAFGAFLAANMIHNDFGLDPAIIPATVLVVLYLWRPRRGLLWASSFVIAFPAFAFLRWRALIPSAEVLPFLNHVALFLAGVFAVVGIAISLIRKSQTRES